MRGLYLCVGIPIFLLFLFQPLSPALAGDQEGSIEDNSVLSEESMELSQARMNMESERYGEAMEIYYALAKKGSRKAQYHLALMYIQGLGTEVDEKEGVRLLRDVADRGLAVAQVTLGEFYYGGKHGLEKNLGEAIGLWKKGAEAGNDYGQWHMAVAYYLGEGVEKNLPEALSWYLKLVRNQHADRGLAAQAACNAGYMYGEGEGAEQNRDKAAELYKASAAGGDPTGTFNLAEAYEKGWGVPKITQKAVEYYSQAAEKGSGDAQFRLGEVFEAGLLGQEVDFGRSLEYYQAAAESGVTSAKLKLGKMYEEGHPPASEGEQGVEIDFDQAKRWYSEAEKEGEATARESLERVNQKIASRNKAVKDKSAKAKETEAREKKAFENAVLARQKENAARKGEPPCISASYGTWKFNNGMPVLLRDAIGYLYSSAKMWSGEISGKFVGGKWRVISSNEVEYVGTFEDDFGKKTYEIRGLFESTRNGVSLKRGIIGQYELTRGEIFSLDMKGRFHFADRNP